MANDVTEDNEFTVVCCNCTLTEVQIKEKIFLYLLFYVYEGQDEGKNMFRAAAETRARNIKNNIQKQNLWNKNNHIVYTIPLKSLDDISKRITQKIAEHANENNKVLVTEMGFFSHAGGDGPIVKHTHVKGYPIKEGDGTINRAQMSLEGWVVHINVKWTKHAKCVFYGCNTANPNAAHPKRNFRNVDVWGQSNSSYPSFYPDYRVTSVGRINNNDLAWNKGNTYLVADDKSEGDFEATKWINKRIKGFKSYSILSDDTADSCFLDYTLAPKAQDMRCYKNGVLILSSHQGVFNEHR